MGKGVDDGCTDTEASKRARTRHKFDFCKVVPGFVVFCEFVSDETEELFGKVAIKNIAVFCIV